MKLRTLIPLIIALAIGARAENAKTYQVTGPIIALTENVITVQKGDEKWEIARDSKTKTEGKLAVGEKVTIHYRMSATSVEAKGSAEPAEPKKEKKKK